MIAFSENLWSDIETSRNNSMTSKYSGMSSLSSSAVKCILDVRGMYYNDFKDNTPMLRYFLYSSGPLTKFEHDHSLSLCEKTKNISMLDYCVRRMHNWCPTYISLDSIWDVLEGPYSDNNKSKIVLVYLSQANSRQSDIIDSPAGPNWGNLFASLSQYFGIKIYCAYNDLAQRKFSKNHVSESESWILFFNNDKNRFASAICISRFPHKKLMDLTSIDDPTDERSLSECSSIGYVLSGVAGGITSLEPTELFQWISIIMEFRISMPRSQTFSLRKSEYILDDKQICEVSLKNFEISNFNGNVNIK